MAKLCREVVQDCLPRAMEKGMDLGYEGADSGDTGVQLQGNATLLKELVRNLVDNAINYVPSTPQRQGVITARVLSQADGSLLLQVEDNGLGIAPEERQRVLQPFYRTLGNQADGSGLGLAIVSEIAQQHQASLDIDDANPLATPPGVSFSLRFNVPK
jgi:two-component system sensor histidine kinase TctE